MLFQMAELLAGLEQHCLQLLQRYTATLQTPPPADHHEARMLVGFCQAQQPAALSVACVCRHRHCRHLCCCSKCCSANGAAIFYRLVLLEGSGVLTCAPCLCLPAQITHLLAVVHAAGQWLQHHQRPRCCRHCPSLA